MYILEEEADVKEQAFAPGPGKNTKKKGDEADPGPSEFPGEDGRRSRRVGPSGPKRKGDIVISVLHKSIDLKWQLGDKEPTASGRVF